jgi:hypothetical protein
LTRIHALFDRRALGRCALALALLLAGAALSSPVAEAAAVDPDLTWRTMETPHWRITFHGGEEALAEEFARVGEAIWEEMTTELQNAPRRRTELVLIDSSDSANGFAMTLPVNTIQIYVTAPQEDSTLATYEDWNDAILTHEMTHILHLDTVEGIPQLLRYVLGRTISVNRVAPGWVIEGQATFQETRNTNAGRGRSTYVDMIKRMTVVEDDFPPLGNLDGFQRDPPGGNLRYLFGQDFQQFIADRAGEKVWTDFFHTYGGFIPYWLPAKQTFGEGINKLYFAWRAEMTERYTRQLEKIQAEGLTPFRLLTDGEDLCSAPTFSPNGASLVWSCSDRERGSAIWLADGQGRSPKRELDQRFANDFTWRGDGKAFAFSSLHSVNRFNLYSDVYFHTLGGGIEALTSGKRARNPDFSEDGREMIAVTNGLQQNQLVRLTVDRRIEALTDNDDHRQLSTPVYSPDGRRLALSMWKDGYRDLWIFDLNGDPTRRVTMDLASDIDPSWSADGRTLYFSSDRTGVYNIYAIDLETEHLFQITNVVGGAFHPSVRPDGSAMVFESFSNDSVDVAWMDLDRAAWRDRGALPRPVEGGEALSAVLPKEPVVIPTPPTGSGAAAEASPPQSKSEARRAKREARKERRGEKRRDRRAMGGQGDVYPTLTETWEYPGLTGVGGAFEHSRYQPGTWGLPGEPLAQGELSADQPGGGADVDDPTMVKEVKKEEDYAFTHPVERYNPLPTLLPPRFVIPSLYKATYGYMGSLSTSGWDPLRRWIYAASVSYRTDSEFVGWSGSVVLNRWVPIFSLGAYSYTVPYGNIYTYEGPPPEGGAWVPSIVDSGELYWDKRTRLYGEAAYSLDSYRSIFATWSGTLRQPLEPLSAQAWRPLLPDRGFLSTVSAGYRFSRGRFYSRSISPEEARVVSVVGQASHPALGSYVLDDTDSKVGFTQLRLMTEWREYQSVPWFPNHVLALKGAVGASAGDNQRYGNYRLGGSFGESSYYTLPDEWRALRGFESATVYGDWYYLGSAEYRLPLFYVDRGVSVIPFFLQSFSFAAFVDAGNAFNEVTETGVLANTLVGAGAELRATAVWLWGVPLSGRLGYAMPVHGEGGVSQGYGHSVYLWFGSSF